MEDISVEDFQSYHNRQPSYNGNVSSPPPISNLHDSDSDPFSSPSPSAHPSSPPNEAIFDMPSRTSSPDTSPRHSGSDDEISVLLSDYQHSSSVSSQHRPSSPYTPLKIRPSGFRNPSSVRAMQDTTPPHYHLNSATLSPKGSQQRYSGSKFPTPSRNGTPRSQRSPSKLTSPSKRAAAVKKEYPLVLLHVTLLPIPTRYSRIVLERVLPTYVLENWKLLREKITPTVLERGILIPHPREDYDLLEERLLETLELRMPRILACGHFHLDKEEEAELDAVAEEERRLQDEGDGSNDADICTDCGRRVRDGRYGSGAGSRRWDIKLYAANGLMRAGAWGAAWREMERVDVEVCPFVNEELKRELELAKEQEEAEEAVRRAEQDLQDSPTGGETKGDHGSREEATDEARMREIYGDDAQDYIDGLRSSPSPPLSPAYDSTAHQPRPRPQHELPLSTLLRNYIVLLSRDPRNLAIALLSLLVVLLAMVARSAGTAPAVYAPMMAAAGQAYPSASSLMPSPSISTFAAAEPTAEAVDVEGEGEAVGGAEAEQAERQASDGVDDGFGGDSTTEKVMRVVDEVLDMVGGGADEIAE
ncbi:MAG: hypothetical protein Q9195_003240 [Heterodermia aff. obscurata]